MKLGTLVKPTELIAYWWRYSLGVVVDIHDPKLELHYTHGVLWDDGSMSYEKPSYLLEVINESR